MLSQLRRNDSLDGLDNLALLPNLHYKGSKYILKLIYLYNTWLELANKKRLYENGKQ